MFKRFQNYIICRDNPQDFLTKQELKISLITVTFNAERTIKDCIESVLAQTYQNIEYIIVDGASTDDTPGIIDNYKAQISLFISGPDKGIYDAMNKGIKFATGDVVGILNADDVFAGNDVLSTVATVFEQKNADIVYGNLNYINLQGKIIRKWKSGSYSDGAFCFGWMPPHPTFYCKTKLFERFGTYNTLYGTAADYELMLRFMHTNKLNIQYLDKVMVNMGIGGVSNKSLANRYAAWKNDFRAMRNNGVFFPLLALMLKPVRKLLQFLP